MSLRGRISLLGVAVMLVAACSSGGGATTAPATQAPVSEAPASQVASEAPASEAPATPIAGGLLDKVLTAGVIKMSTDPQYPPQSSLKSDGTFEGFDIDVGTEIAKRLGVDIAFETPDWNLITAGSWGGRWDFSVGSMTITTPREKVLAFSQPYYYTPAQMAASTESGITTVDGLAGKVICVGEATTYFDWMSGTLDLGTYTPTAKPPEGSTVTDAQHGSTVRRHVEGRPQRLRGLAELVHDGGLRRSRTACRSSRSATRCTPSRSASRSTRAAPIRPTWSRGSTRSSTR